MKKLTREEMKSIKGGFCSYIYWECDEGEDYVYMCYGDNPSERCGYDGCTAIGNCCTAGNCI
jgi:hypothetical protein